MIDQFFKSDNLTIYPQALFTQRFLAQFLALQMCFFAAGGCMVDISSMENLSENSSENPQKEFPNTVHRSWKNREKKERVRPLIAAINRSEGWLEIRCPESGYCLSDNLILTDLAYQYQTLQAENRLVFSKDQVSTPWDDKIVVVHFREHNGELSESAASGDQNANGRLDIYLDNFFLPEVGNDLIVALARGDEEGIQIIDALFISNGDRQISQDFSISLEAVTRYFQWQVERYPGDEEDSIIIRKNHHSQTKSFNTASRSSNQKTSLTLRRKCEGEILLDTDQKEDWMLAETAAGKWTCGNPTK